MKRQKRDRFQRAYVHGYKAGITGRSRDDCPSQDVNLREYWMSGWREGRGDQWAAIKRALRVAPVMIVPVKMSIYASIG